MLIQIKLTVLAFDSFMERKGTTNVDLVSGVEVVGQLDTVERFSVFTMERLFFRILANLNSQEFPHPIWPSSSRGP